MLHRHRIIDFYRLWDIINLIISLGGYTMAEFCLKCFNELNGTNYQANEIWLEEDLCEGCADWKPCVMELRPKPLLWRLVDVVRKLCVKNERY